MSGILLKKGMEYGRRPKSPHLTNTVGIGNGPLMKVSHWGNLRRQGRFVKVRVGRTAVQV